MAKPGKQQSQYDQWPASTVTLWPLEKIKSYSMNPRSHPDSQVDKLAADMMTYGVTTPILVDEAGVIIYGHGRRLAAERNKFTHYPVAQALGWSEEKKRAARIADNKRGTESFWSPELLRIELSELKAGGFDIGQIGFSADELAALLNTTKGKTDPEFTPPPPAKASVQTGELWLLGRHRLLCGDSTNADNVALVLAGKKPHLMVTDPPYGVEYNAAWREKALPSKANGRAIGTVQNDARMDWRAAWELFPGDVIYCWHADRHAASVQLSIEAVNFEIRCQIIWAKQQFAVGRGDYHWQHEPCWYAVRKGRPGQWSGDRKQSTLWQIDKPAKSETGHSTQKPVECMQRPMRNNSKAGDLVYDPFVGSGTTIIAAEECGRTCMALEIDPAYVEVAIERWEKFTGLKAQREDGATLAEVRKGGAAKSKATKPKASGKGKKLA